MAHITQMVGGIADYDERKRIEAIMSNSLPKLGTAYINASEIENTYTLLLMNLERAVGESSLGGSAKGIASAIIWDAIGEQQYQKLYDWLDSDELKAALKRETAPDLQAAVKAVGHVRLDGYSNQSLQHYLNTRHGVYDARANAERIRHEYSRIPGDAGEKAIRDAEDAYSRAQARANWRMQPVMLRAVKLDPPLTGAEAHDDMVKLGMRAFQYRHDYRTSGGEERHEDCLAIPCAYPSRPRLPDSECVRKSPQEAQREVGELLAHEQVTPGMVRSRYGEDFLEKAQGFERERLEHLGPKWRDYQRDMLRQDFERDAEGGGLLLTYLLAKKQLTPAQIEEAYGKAFVEEAFRPDNVALVKERLGLDWPYEKSQLNGVLARKPHGASLPDH